MPVVLVGLGLGPGDPELLTLKAVRLLKEADEVFVPGSIARDLVTPYREATVLEFPMTDNEAEIQQCMEKNADIIAPVAENRLAVLGILGDPNFFSTFSRLAGVMGERYPGIVCTSEPGVSAITAFAAVSGVSLSGGFFVTDGGDPACRIVLKVKKPREVVNALQSEGYRTFILVERMFLSDMRVYRGEEIPETSDYMSILYAGM
ncbi:MAG TPA: cobalt-factor II C(20)-methyltransferase [Methanoregulaceae archaeon]|nr:cobalt-factor II C(20)-methyltransferase [Methanoregulaceae archaeon]